MKLNQPLAAILTNARAAQRLLARGRPDLTEFRAILDDIVGDDLRTAEIIQRLRQVFRRGEIQPQPVAVNELVRAVLKIAESELASDDVELRAQFADNLPLVGGDRVQPQQVLLNLIANACHAMSDVEVAARRLEVRTGPSTDASLCVTVSDCGRGIPREDLTRIFDPFFTTRSEGMGLEGSRYAARSSPRIAGSSGPRTTPTAERASPSRFRSGTVQAPRKPRWPRQRDDRALTPPGRP
jgi:C4-dicarboxylate-specific signal transduction histidine kinase